MLTVVPVPRGGLMPWLATLEPLDVSFPEVGDDGLPPLDEPTCDVTRYLLDTDTLSWLVRDPAGAVARRLAAAGEDAVATSSIVAGELRFGAQRSGSEALVARVDERLARLQVLALDERVVGCRHGFAGNDVVGFLRVEGDGWPAESWTAVWPRFLPTAQPPASRPRG